MPAERISDHGSTLDSAVLVSVVIPTYNRLPILQQCLRALEAQRPLDPGDSFEVVPVSYTHLRAHET